MPTCCRAVAWSSISRRWSRGGSLARSAWFHVWSPIALPSATALLQRERELCELVAEDEERRLHVLALQRVEDPLRVRAGAVVEGQRDAAGLRAGEPHVGGRLERARDGRVLERALGLLAVEGELCTAGLLLQAQPRKLGLRAVAQRDRIPGSAAARARRDDDDEQQRGDREHGRGDAPAATVMLGLRRSAAAAGRVAHRHGGW